MKHYSQNARRKNKKALPELEPVPKKYASGNRKEPESQDPRRTALEARCRQFGIDTTKKDQLRVSGPHMGCQIGLVMESIIGSDTGSGKEEIDALWSVLCRLAASYAVYRRRYIGQAEEPACQAIMTSQEFDVWFEAMETTTGPDLRTPEEKDNAAVTNWMRWQGYLGRLDGDQRKAVQRARMDEFEKLWRDQGPTVWGKVALDGLRELRGMVD